MQSIRMGTKRYELAESEWSRIKDMLPPEHPKEGKRGRPAKCDNRTDAVDCQRKGTVERASGAVRPVTDNIQPFSKVVGYGMFERIFQPLSIDADFEDISIDSTSYKLHQSTNSKEKRKKLLAYPETAEIR